MIRPATVHDEPDVLRVIEAAFGERTVADLWRDVGPTTHASLVAEVEGRVVGHVGLSPAWVDARRALVDVWVLSPLSVLPDVQRRGHGTALVEASVAAARRAGAPLLFLEGSPDYYGPRGFEPAGGCGFGRPSDRVPGPAFQVAVLDTWQEWMTGRLVYPDVWWRHDSVGLRDPLLARVEQSLGLESPDG